MSQPHRREAVYFAPDVPQAVALESTAPFPSAYGKVGYWLCNEKVMFLPKVASVLVGNLDPQPGEEFFITQRIIRNGRSARKEWLVTAETPYVTHQPAPSNGQPTDTLAAAAAMGIPETTLERQLRESRQRVEAARSLRDKLGLPQPPQPDVPPVALEVVEPPQVPASEPTAAPETPENLTIPDDPANLANPATAVTELAESPATESSAPPATVQPSAEGTAPSTVTPPRPRRRRRPGPVLASIPAPSAFGELVVERPPEAIERKPPQMETPPALAATAAGLPATAAPVRPAWAEKLIAETSELVDAFGEVLRRAGKHGPLISSEDVRSLLVTDFISLRDRARGR